MFKIYKLFYKSPLRETYCIATSVKQLKKIIDLKDFIRFEIVDSKVLSGDWLNYHDQKFVEEVKAFINSQLPKLKVYEVLFVAKDKSGNKKPMLQKVIASNKTEITRVIFDKENHPNIISEKDLKVYPYSKDELELIINYLFY